MHDGVVGCGGLLFQYLQDFDIFEKSPHQLQEELLNRLNINGVHDDNGIIIEDGSQTHVSELVDNLALTSTLPEYDVRGSFKSRESIIEKPLLELNPLMTTISMMSSGEDIITSGTINASDIKAIDSIHPQHDVFYDCKKNLLENPRMENLFSITLDGNCQESQAEKDQIVQKNKSTMVGPLEKCVNSRCLDSKEWMNAAPTGSSFLDFQEVGVGSVFGMRRAYSEGDIKMGVDSHKIEERRQKLSRYMKKKAKRNFGRKIKYACRKALAESQPRVRGRFARTEECERVKALK